MPKRISVIAFAAIIALAASLHAENWPQFRGSDGNATSAAAQLPLNWSETENLLWKAKLPGRGASSPIVWKDHIFLTAFTGFGTSKTNDNDRSKLRLNVMCISRNDGSLVWNESIPASKSTQAFSTRIQDHGYASGTPVTDGKAVYAYFGVSGLVAYTMAGKLMWQAHTGNNTAGFGSASSPVLHENLVIVNASIEDGKVIAFDKQSGEKVWSIDDVERSWTTPCPAQTADGNTELVINQIDLIRGFDPLTGKELWRCSGIDDYIVPTPVFDDGIVYCLGGRQNRCVAVKLGGRGDVTDSHKLWQVNVGANVTSPVYYKGHLYWASDKAIANCLNAKTGETVYSKRLDTRSRIYASIVRGGERLYVTTRDKGVTVLPAKPEYSELAVNSIASDEGLINGSPAISEDQLFLRTDNYLYCIGVE